MSDIEKDLIDYFIRNKQTLLNLVENNKRKTSLLEIMFIFEGVADRIVYDYQLNKFTKIIYQIGKGIKYQYEPEIFKNSGYFSEIEERSIDILNYNN